MMPTSAPGASSRRGFTLIELLVVLLIMGLLAGLVGTLVRPDERAVLRVEADRLAQLLELASDESRLTGKPLAWTADETRYRFWRWRGDAGWMEAREESLRPRSLPPGMSVYGPRIEFDPYVPALYEVQMSLGNARVQINDPR
jgi:general secretion pathway protein H